MTVSYESTVREMDAEELEAEYKRLRLFTQRNPMSLRQFWRMYKRRLFIRRQYLQMTGKNISKAY